MGGRTCERCEGAVGWPPRSMTLCEQGVNRRLLQLLERRSLARGQLQVGVHPTKHVVDRRRGTAAVVCEVIGDYVRSDLCQDPCSRGEQRREIGKLAVADREIAELVVSMMRRDDPNGAHDLNGRCRQMAVNLIGR